MATGAPSARGRKARIDGWWECRKHPSPDYHEDEPEIGCRNNKTFSYGTKLRCTALRFVPRSMVDELDGSVQYLSHFLLESSG